MGGVGDGMLRGAAIEGVRGFNGIVHRLISSFAIERAQQIIETTIIYHSYKLKREKPRGINDLARPFRPDSIGRRQPCTPR